MYATRAVNPEMTSPVKIHRDPFAATAASVGAEKIGKLAFRLWLMKGCPANKDLEIWLEAEEALVREQEVRDYQI
jgi:hypothetical protein